MSITLASTWNPRGETVRFRRLYPFLSTIYDHIVVIMPPQTHAGLVLSLKVYQKLTAVVVDDWSAGRYESLRLSSEKNDDHIHYADMDRLIRWAETRPVELRKITERIRECECLVIGRTEEAYQTHPQALIQTEAASNKIFSHILGQLLDISAGSKGFSASAVRFIVKNSKPGRALGTDSEWVILARRGGYKIESVLVEGLDWESADRYSDAAADAFRQAEAAAIYDEDAKNWAHRMAVANEIIEVGIETLKRPLV